MHGLLQTSMIFVASGDESLAIQLALSGYDVWFGNNRGNKHSRKHATLSPDDDLFWSWSIDELARYDLKTLVTHVLASTNKDRQKLVLCGHSQGAAQAMAAIASQDDAGWWDDRISLFIAMSMSGQIRGFYRWPMMLVQWLYSCHPETFFALYGEGAFLGSLEAWQTLFSLNILTYMEACFYTELLGWSTEQWSWQTSKNYFAETPGGTSCQIVSHWMQSAVTGEFTTYARHHWKAKTVPYRLESLSLPVCVVLGSRDDLINTEALLSQLPNIVHRIIVPHHGHMDNLCGADAGKYISRPLVDLLNKRHKNKE